MLVAIPSSDGSLNGRIDERFGRAQSFIIYDLENDEYEVLSNPYLDGGGAGIKVGNMLAKKGVNKVIAVRLGPNAQTVLSEAGIQFIQAKKEKTIEENIKDL